MALTTAAAILGSAVIGGAASAIGSSKAAKAQTKAAQEATAAQERASALALEAQKTGNAEAIAAAKEAAAAAQTAQDAANKEARDLSRAGYDETKGLYGQGFDSAQAAYDKSFTGAQSAFDQAYQRQAGLQNPYIQSGLTAQNQIMQLMGLGGDKNAADYGQYAKQFGTEQFEQDPGYAFRQAEGMKALERSASARGGLMSGGALKGIQRFGQDLASQEFSNAFNRYQTERGARLNTLGGLSSAGQSASNVMTNAAGQYGSNTAGNNMAYGNATAANSLGRANAMAGNAADYYGTQGNLALAQGQNTAQNQYNIADAVSRGAQNIANAGSQSAYNVGNAQAQGAMNAGQARASGYVGAANAFNNALGQVGSYYANAPMNNAMMNYYNNNSPSTTRAAAAAPSMVMQQPVFGYDPYTGRGANYLTNT